MPKLINGQEQLDPSQVSSAVDQAVTNRLSDTPPMSEAKTPAAGMSTAIPRQDHQHPRLTSATVGAVASGNTATVTFTRAFANEPTIDYCELPATATTVTPDAADTAANAQPTTAKVIAWTRDGQGNYTGCTLRVWRSQTIPTNLATLLLGGVFSVFSASVVGTRFSIIALARSDT